MRADASVVRTCSRMTCDRLENVVSGFVPVRVIDDLEVIHVGEHKRTAAAHAIGQVERARELVVKVAPVSKTRELVDPRGGLHFGDFP
jgi:hypothetical protein